MIYTWFRSLKKRYTDGVDYSFTEGEPKLYENMTWLDGDKPSLETFEAYAAEDTDNSVLEIVRKQRNELLAETDWRFRSDLAPNQDWIDYCQALRDVPQDNNNWTVNANGDVTVNWPTPPNS